jgi:Tfp pilus assembly PilM family ATPase
MGLLHKPVWQGFGIEISDRWLRLAQTRRRSDGSHRLNAWSVKALPAGVVKNGVIEKPEILQRAMEKLLNGAGGRLGGRTVVTGLPDNESFLLTFTGPATADEVMLNQLIRQEIESNVPLAVEDTYHSWQSLALTETPADKDKPSTQQRLLLAAGSKRLLDGYRTSLLAADLVPVVVEPAAMALTRAVLPSDPNSEESKAVLYLGLGTASLVIAESNLAVASVSISQNAAGIAATIGKASRRAAKAVHEQLASTGLSELGEQGHERLTECLDGLAHETSTALSYFNKRSPENMRPIGELVLCGRASAWPGFSGALAERLDIPTTISSPASRLAKVPKDIEPMLLHDLTVAIGLAIRANEEALAVHDLVLHTKKTPK